MSHSGQAFSVQVLYREPTYELVNASRPRVYTGTFDVCAQTAEGAADAALREFRRMEAESSVSWFRDVVSLRITHCASGSVSVQEPATKGRPASSEAQRIVGVSAPTKPDADSTFKPCVACAKEPGSSWRCRDCGALLGLGEYTIEAQLGVSARGRVYRAQGPDGLVALKELSYATVPTIEAIDRFDHEARVLGALDHPKIPRLIERFSDGQGPELRLYIAESFVSGPNLEARLEKHYFVEEEAKAIAADILEVLAYLHSRSPVLTHCNVRPENIVACAEGYALVDFHSVREGVHSPGTSQSWRETFGYTPPELLGRPGDTRNDLYALGMTLLRILARRPAFELFDLDLNVVFLPYVNVGSAFSAFLGRLVARSPTDRFGSAEEARAALKDLLKAPAPKAAMRNAPPTVLSVPRTAPAQAQQKEAPAPAPVLEQVTRRPGGHVRWLVGEPLPMPSKNAVPWLVILGGKRLGLRPGCKYLVGRSSSCQVQVADELDGASSVSREHVCLEVVNAGLRITECGSSNGTQVGSSQLKGRQSWTLIRDSSWVYLGKLRMHVGPDFKVLDGAGPPEPEPANCIVSYEDCLSPNMSNRDDIVRYVRIRRRREP